MSNESQDFQKELKDSIINADPKLDKKELLTDIFKAYTAKLFEIVIVRKGKNQIPFDALVLIKSNLISEFRGASLAEYQQSEKWYEDLFESTVQEILNEAALNHQGVNDVSIDPNKDLSIDVDGYINEGGLFVPEHLKR